MATLLPMQSSFPSFIQACSKLLMDEISANKRARLDTRPEATATALAVGHTPGSALADQSPSGDRSSTDRGKSPTASPAGESDRGGRGRGRGRGSTAGRGTPPPGPAALPAGFFAPYGALLPNVLGARPPWAAPNAAGVLGPRPPPSHQAYPMAARPTPGHGPSWEKYHQLYTALQNLMLKQQHAGGTPDWFLDTGATSHVAGPSHGESDHEIK
ncbi:uncharacterized protein LOC123425854 [Hordeum vulgare subsp. vulgare]|uniref:uncharacterized protein LOC123425854 n=1 Tax=Hordeum vulgare subsp. vulgare TaxID=112509 RepID=UPI001D1A3800|nr:uncharacterized protein LOC123425854 [Hordeum vulgare subsp. vulgare]